MGCTSQYAVATSGQSDWYPVSWGDHDESADRLEERPFAAAKKLGPPGERGNAGRPVNGRGLTPLSLHPRIN